MSDDSEKQRRGGGIHAVIDRVEDGDWAVILLGDDESVEINFPASLLPEGARDGDHLRIRITLDKKSRRAAEDRVREMQERLRKQSGTQGKKSFKL